MNPGLFELLFLANNANNSICVIIRVDTSSEWRNFRSETIPEKLEMNGV